MNGTMVPLAKVVENERSPGRGFEAVYRIDGATYRDNSTVIVVPTRGTRTPDGKPDPLGGMIHHRVTQAHDSLLPSMNGNRIKFYASGFEVGDAYNAVIKNVLAHPELRQWKYILTLEDDNLPPPDAHIRLLESIEWGHFDAVSGLYFTKGEWQMPMAYGDPEEFRRTGVLDFRPRDVREALDKGMVMTVNGIACGCALWRTELFRDIVDPWYVTVNDIIDGSPQAWTQDLKFCEKAVRSGKRFAVDCRVKVGHIDVKSGIVY